jgi:uncharacterized protein (TIGR02996 family)
MSPLVAANCRTIQRRSSPPSERCYNGTVFALSTAIPSGAAIMAEADSIHERERVDAMTTEQAFLQAIRDASDDDTPRLIYADWLEEHGQSDRADFIRLQCRLARRELTSERWDSLQTHAQELLRRNWTEWVGTLRDLVGSRRDRYGESWLGEEFSPGRLSFFPRGFVQRLSLDAESFIRGADALARLTALRELRLWGAGGRAAALANAYLLSNVHTLFFADYYEEPLTARDAAALASSPYLDKLSWLLLPRNSLGDEGVEALVRAPWLAGVTCLDLTENSLTDRAARALADSPYLFNLQSLHVCKNAISTRGVAGLRHASNLPRLSKLEYDSPTE